MRLRTTLAGVSKTSNEATEIKKRFLDKQHEII
jgi:hypothetical protein